MATYFLYDRRFFPFWLFCWSLIKCYTSLFACSMACKGTSADNESLGSGIPFLLALRFRYFHKAMLQIVRYTQSRILYIQNFLMISNISYNLISQHASLFKFNATWKFLDLRYVLICENA